MYLRAQNLAEWQKYDEKGKELGGVYLIFLLAFFVMDVFEIIATSKGPR